MACRSGGRRGVFRESQPSCAGVGGGGGGGGGVEKVHGVAFECCKCRLHPPLVAPTRPARCRDPPADTPMALPRCA